MYVKFRSTEILDNLAKYLWRKIAHKRAVEYVKLCEGFWQTGLGITQGFVNQFCKISEDGRQTDKDKGLNIWTGAFYLSGNKTNGRNFSSGDPVLAWKEIKRTVWRKILTIKCDKKQRTWLVNQKALNEKAFLQVFGRKVLKRVEKYEHVRFC